VQCTSFIAVLINIALEFLDIVFDIVNDMITDDPREDTCTETSDQG
jgi:hypothetical protein